MSSTRLLQATAGDHEAIGRAHRRPVGLKAGGTSVASLAYRASWTLVGIGLVNWSVTELAPSTTVYWWTALLMVLVGAWGLGTAVLCWLPVLNEERWRLWRAVGAWATVAVVIGAFAAWTVLAVRAAPGYSTDEVAFDQYAGLLASHGADPYLHSMRPSFALYDVPPNVFTYRLDGTPVTSLSYPALSFLAYVPLMLLGWSTQVAIGVNIAAWCATIALTFALLPREVRPFALIVSTVSAYVSFTLSGVTDILYLPLLVGAAYGWAKFSHRHGWRRYTSPVLLGLAMCVKQTPWIDAPFLLAGVFLEARAAKGARQAVRAGAQYAAATIAAFLLPNIYYIAAGPVAWLRGVLTPVGSDLVPDGQGLVGLSVFVHLGGGSLAAYTLLVGAVFVALLATYVLTYPVLRPVTFLFASIVMFFAARSFGTYLVSMLPVMVVSAASTEQGTIRRPRRVAEGPTLLSWRQAVVITAVVLPLGATAFALSSGQPIKLMVDGLRSTGALDTIEQLDVTATNRLAKPVSPHFAVQEGGGLTTFWLVAQGPKVLPPHTSASYVLDSPNYPSQPPLVGGFQVMAFTTQPRAVSASSPYLAQPDHLSINPQAVNHIVPIGRPVFVSVQLLDPFGAPVKEKGVPVYLSQIIYSQDGFLFAEATINGSPPGQTPVVAYTNSDGEAEFRIVGTAELTQDPVYFQAYLLKPGQAYPYGYSQLLAIRFSG